MLNKMKDEICKDVKWMVDDIASDEFNVGVRDFSTLGCLEDYIVYSSIIEEIYECWDDQEKVKGIIRESIKEYMNSEE